MAQIEHFWMAGIMLGLRKERSGLLSWELVNEEGQERFTFLGTSVNEGVTS